MREKRFIWETQIIQNRKGHKNKKYHRYEKYDFQPGTNGRPVKPVVNNKCKSETKIQDPYNYK